MSEPDYLGHRQRLRDRFLKGGGKDMPDYEFLELVLMIAIPRRDVKPLAKELIKKFGNFSGVVSAPLDELMEVDGLKENSAAVIKIIKEAALRLSWQILQSKKEVVIDGWDVMIDYCHSSMAHLDVEEFRILFLDVKYRLIKEEVQQRGTIDQVAIHPREVIRAAMREGAKAIILVHNHPSGDVAPSKADIEVTKKIRDAVNAVGIELIDHLIVTKRDYYSFKDHHLL